MADFFGLPTDDVYPGTADPDLIFGNGGNDALNGAGGNDTIRGGPGNDVIDGGADDDNIQGNDGDDNLTGGDGSDLIRGGAGVDTFSGGSENPLSTTFGPGSFGDRISFFEQAATQGVIADLRTGIIANDGFGNVETMTGIESLGGDTAFADTFDGNDQRNLILAATGDTVRAWGEDDVIQLSGAASLLDGGLGTDTLSVITQGPLVPDNDGDGIAEFGPAMTAGWFINLQNNTMSDGYGNGGTILGIENVNGTELGDTIFGNFADNVIHGGDGGDNLRGNGGNDTLVGGGGNDLMRGGPGVDSFDGGDSTLVFDGQPGGFGDRVSFSEATATQGVSADLATGIIANDGFGNVETMTGIESLGADTAYADTLHGDDNPNFIWGALGDFLYGRGGDDQMQMNGAAAMLDGGTGIDTLQVNSIGYMIPDADADGVAEQTGPMTAGWQVDLLAGTVVDGFGSTGSVAGIENLVGSKFDDVLFGNDVDNAIDGGDGNDIVRGRGGADHLIGGLGNDTLVGAYTTAFGPQPGDGPDHLEGGDGNDTLRGGDGDDWLEGGADSDNLRGDSGSDSMDGGLGDDFVSYVFTSLGAGVGFDARNFGATITFTVADPLGGTDTLSNVEHIGVSGTEFDDFIRGSLYFTATAFAYGNQLFGNGGNDTIFGGNSNDFIEGGDGDDSLRGLGGDDILNGGAGSDLIRGGAGIDTFDGGSEDPLSTTFGPNGFGDRISFFEDTATQGVSADLRTGIIANDGFGNAETMTGIEGLGGDTAYVDTFHGNDARNILLGSKSDFVYGHGGDDFIQMSGAGTVDGGSEIDSLSVNTAGYLIPDSTGDGVAENSGAMTAGWTVNLFAGFLQDGFGNGGSVTGIENVSGTEFADLIIGNAADNKLEGGDGNDTIRGRDGSDHIIGGDGNDSLQGGFNSGFGPQPGDLADHIEGGNGNDVLRGGDGDDVLEGGADNDNLRGDAGSDTMSGGDGRDFVSYVYTSLAAGITLDGRAYGATATFTVADFFGGTDTISDVESIGLGGTEFDDTIWGSLHFTHAAGSFANQMSGFGGNDVIHGAANNDYLTGDDGNDTLDAGGGDDELYGGAGNDDLDGGTGSDTAFFLLNPGAVGVLSVVEGTGPDAGKQLVLLTDGATVTRVAEITVSGAVLTVTGVNSGSGMGTDTVTNVQHLVFVGDFSDPAPADPLTIDVAAVTGIVSDGYLAGATIFIDENGNGALDPGELSTVTDANGNFTLPELGAGNLVAIGGVNTDTGLANNLVLTAPNGATAVNPLTTLVQAIVEQSGVDAATAQAQLLGSLGLDPGLDLLNTDLIAAAQSGDGDALAAQQAAAIVATIIAAAEDAAGGAAGAEGDAIAQLADLIASGDVDLTDSGVIEQVLEAAAPDAGDLGAIADQVADTAETIAEADSLEEIADAQGEAMLTGNDLDNVLTGGNAGEDLTGFGGDDVLTGGNGVDRLSGGTGHDRFVHQINADKVASKTGPIALDLILDFHGGEDKIDLSGIDANLGLAGDQAFKLVGNNSGNRAGDLWVQTYGNMNAAEKALGIEIDGVDGKSPFDGKVTIMFGNVDGGAPDFALVLIGAPTIVAADLIL